MWRVIQDLLHQRMTMVYNCQELSPRGFATIAMAIKTRAVLQTILFLATNVDTFLGSILRCPQRTTPRLVQALLLVTWTYTMGLKPVVFLPLCI